MKVKLIVDKLKNLEGLNTGFKKIEQSAEKTAKSTKKSFSEIGKSLVSFKSLIAGSLLTGAFIKFTKAAAEQEKAVAKVEAKIKSTGAVAGLTSKQLQKAASDLQKNSLFGDEEILGKVTQNLLSFTNIAGEQFKRTQQVALDLAATMEGDLQGATLQLGKALNDPVKNLSALSRSGIQFSNDQITLIKSLVETGDKAEAQRVILKELENQFGGTAAAVAKAGLGPFKQMQNQLGDLGEQIGSVLLPVIKAVANIIKSLPTELNGLTSVFITLGGVLGTLTVAFRSFNLAMKGTVVLAIVSGVILLISEFINLRKQFGSTGAGFKAFGLKAELAILKVQTTLRKFVTKTLGKIPGFGKVFTKGFEELESKAIPRIKAIKAELNGLLTEQASLGNADAKAALIDPDEILKKLQGKLNEQTNVIAKPKIKIEPVIESSKLADEISSKIKGAQSQLSSAVSGLDLTSELGRSTAEAAINATSEIINAVSAQLEANGFTPEEIQTRLSDLRNSISDINQDIVAGEAALSENQKFIANELTNGFSDFISTALEGTGNLKDSFLGAIGSIAKTIQDKIINELVGSLVSSAFGAVSTGGIIKNNAVKNLPAFKDGGGNFGQFSGRGTGTSDSILARVSNGEFITDAATTSFFGSGFFKQLKNISRGRADIDSLANFIGKKAPGFANGGLIGGLNDFSYSLRHFDLPKFNTGGEVSAQGGGTINANLPINVNIVNNGSEKKVRTKGPTFDQKGATISIIMEDLRNNGDVSKALQGVFGVRRGG